MAENENSFKNRDKHASETFQESAKVDQPSLSSHSTGIVPLPPGSRGPRSLYLKRHGDTFGFTLRHFIVYPPDNITTSLDRHAAIGALNKPMDTIFVKNVAPRGPAEVAGLQKGDRIVAVNGIPVIDKSYAQVVHLIQHSPDYLHLLVVPKEEDVLQKFFAETAHNPISNQISKQEQFVYPHLNPNPYQDSHFQVDANSWRHLQEPTYSSVDYDRLGQHPVYSSNLPENYRYTRDRDKSVPNKTQPIYSEPYPDESLQRPKAQPQVPLYRKMGRRASEGNVLYNHELQNYELSPYLNGASDEMAVNSLRTKGVSNKISGGSDRNNFSTDNTTMPVASYANSVACRLSLDGGRRESSSSLTSSLADGSKDSLSSFDSTSTLTGQETDDSVIMNRFRKTFQQKEEFLKSKPVEVIQREFYGQPKKLEKPIWPPSEPEKRPEKQNRTKPMHQNFQKIKMDIDKEQDYTTAQVHRDGKPEFIMGGAINNFPQQRGVPSPKENWKHYSDSVKVQEASTAPTDFNESVETYGSASYNDSSETEKRMPLPNLQMVSKRAKQFESGKPLPEDDPMVNDRTSFYKSELARLSNKRVVPNVTDRAQEFESRASSSSEPKRDASSSSANSFASTKGEIKRIHKDSRSLESSDMPELDNSINRHHMRSNSADSWASAVEELPPLSKSDSLTKQAQVYFPDSNQPVVVRRKKNADLTDEERIMRRESYLKATGTGRMYVDDYDDENTSPLPHRSAHRKWRPPLFPGDIQQLRKLFEDAASSLGGSASEGSSGNVSLERDKSSYPSSPLDKDQVIKEGPLQCKIAEIDGKKSGDRSWKPVWAVLRGPRLYFYKERNHQSPSDSAEQTLSNGVDMRASCVRVAEDYTKRKHVLRVSSALPCRSEILLQADNPIDLADWVKALQEQVAATTDVEAKLDPLSSSTKQQAVPQQVPASTTIQVQGSSRLSPPPNKSKLPNLRNRSPTGQSPVSKTRKPSQIVEGSTSPKPKTWRGRMAKQIRKIQGASSPSSPIVPEGSTFGVPLEQCYPSYKNQYIPRLVEACTEIVESKGLETVGIYRVPGNNAAITALTNAVNQCYDGIPASDSHWNDIHVVSSLLKSFFRKLPDALLTKALYSKFIEADKIEDPYLRMNELRKVVNQLPPHHYHTLKHLMLHLKKVMDKGHINKMEGKNLAIVFGPTLIRTSQDDMATMVNDMNHNYRIVESLICHADWFFSDDRSMPLNLGTAVVPPEESHGESEVASNRALLLDNISKIENLKDQKEKKEILSSIISAAHRKVMRKAVKNVQAPQDMKEETVTTENKEYTYQSNAPTDFKENATTIESKTHIIPTTVMDMEKPPSQPEKVPWFNYSDQEKFRRRVENFIQETQANLQRSRKADLENFLSNLPRTNFNDTQVLPKMTSNVVYRTTSNGTDSSRNSAFAGQYSMASDLRNKNMMGYRGSGSDNSKLNSDFNQNRRDCRNDAFGANINKVGAKGSESHVYVPDNLASSQRGTSSMENIHRAVVEAANNSNGNIKKVKYGNESELNQRSGSLDSIHKISSSDEGSDLQTSIMEIFDKKKKMLNPLSGDDLDLPFADESPNKSACKQLRENSQVVPGSPKLYRNPSLHKNTIIHSKPLVQCQKVDENDESKSKELIKGELEEKDKDSTENVPDNDKNISNDVKKNTNVTAQFNSSSKLKRSESLNKPERTNSYVSKLKRSESLNKSSDRLKRLENLTKHEKTESNLNKRRELTTRRNNKEVVKLKRKNGMPERSIKRRHTVGGTKDFDKVSWLDNRQQEKPNLEKDIKEKSLRTSSPDLSSTRKERLFFEVSLVGPENMVVALRQHLIGARPQSLPEPRVFTVPLESHV